MSALNRLLSFIPIAFLSACAAVTSPSGGPKDEIKPLLQKSSPETGERNFTSKVIKLTFSEEVQTKDLNKELIITPNTGNAYTVKTTGNEIELLFDKGFEENTTYFLDFRDGIEDIREGNKAENIKLAFSTGADIDTGKVSGTVTDYLTNRPEASFTIALYPESDTTNIRAKAPYYFTKTNTGGQYSLQNIKAGNYWIFAHNDKNDNQTYDQTNEKIGYLPKPITVADKPLKQDIMTVIVDTKKPFIISTQNYTDKNTLVFNEGIRQYNFKTLESPAKDVKLLANLQLNGKNLDVYPDNGKLPEQVLVFSIDSSYNEGIDTIKFNLSGKAGIPANLIGKLKDDKPNIAKGEKIELEFPIPIQINGATPFTIIADSIKEIKPKYPSQYSLNLDKTILTVNTPIEANKNINIKSDSTLISGVNGKPFKKINILVPVSTNEEKTGTGSLAGIIKTAYKSYLVELIDDKGKVVKYLVNPKTFLLRNLAVGSYSIQVKIDENNNGRWETGSKNLKTAPEKIYRYPKKLAIRANWDIEDLIIQF